MNEELVWAAGFYEGEGNINFSGRHLSMTVSQLDREPLERFLAAMGQGKIYGPYLTRGRKNAISTWKVSGGRAQACITVLWSQLSGRRRVQAEEALDAWENRSRRGKVQQ